MTQFPQCLGVLVGWKSEVSVNKAQLMSLRAYNVVSGLFQAPYFAYSQTMMAEVSPPGFDNMVRPVPVFRPQFHSNSNLSVLWVVRSIKPGIVHTRAERYSGDH